VRILLTGVTGVVGRAVARQLVAAGYAVTGIATLPHENLHPDVDVVCGPLDHPMLQQLADESDVVLTSPRSKPARPAAAESMGWCTSHTRRPARVPG
jgi:nucleoside-diphosphate-sugar epimerase